MVPLAPGYLVLDLMAEMSLGVLIVARLGLGTINHTLLTVYACRERGLKVVGVVLNGCHSVKGDLAAQTNPAVIAEVGDVPVLAVIPYDIGTCVEEGRLGNQTIQTISQVDWAGLTPSNQ